METIIIMISKGLYNDENKLKLPTEQNKVLLGARQAQFEGFLHWNFTWFFYIKVYGKPGSIWAGMIISIQKIAGRGIGYSSSN